MRRVKPSIAEIFRTFQKREIVGDNSLIIHATLLGAMRTRKKTKESSIGHAWFSVCAGAHFFSFAFIDGAKERKLDRVLGFILKWSLLF